MTYQLFGYTSRERGLQIAIGFMMLLIAIFSMRSLGSGIQTIDEGGGYFVASLWFVASAAALYLCKLAYKALRKVGQRRRDEIARSIFIKARSGEIRPFCLFLRPFYITDRMRVRRYTWPYPILRTHQTTTYFLEDQIITALGNAALGKPIPVIGLGEPGETAGVGRLLVDERDWPASASELIDHALFIILVPSNRPGTKLELDYIIQNGLINKTVFMMAPDETLLFKFKKLRHDWERISEYVKSNGIEFFSYKSSGLLFRINPGGECIKENLGITSPKEFRQAIERLSAVKFEDQALPLAPLH